MWDAGTWAFCKCANVDELPAIARLLPAASSVPAQKHALWKTLDTHKGSDAWRTCLTVQTCMLTLLFTQLHTATKTCLNYKVTVGEIKSVSIKRELLCFSWILFLLTLVWKWWMNTEKHPNYSALERFDSKCECVAKNKNKRTRQKQQSWSLLKQTTHCESYQAHTSL